MKKLFGNWITWCVLVTLLMAGCFSPFGWLRRAGSPRAPKKSETYHDWDETTHKKPVAVVTGEKGKVTVVSEEIKTLHVTYKDKTEEAKLSWWQRMCAWFGNLGTIGIVLVVIALIVAPGATVTFLITRARKLGGALRQVVKAVKEAKVVDNTTDNKNLHDSLSSNLTRKSKELVGKIKAQL